MKNKSDELTLNWPGSAAAESTVESQLVHECDVLTIHYIITIQILMLIGSASVFWSFQLNFQSFHANLETIHCLNSCLSTCRIIKRHKTCWHKIRKYSVYEYICANHKIHLYSFFYCGGSVTNMKGNKFGQMNKNCWTGTKNKKSIKQCKIENPNCTMTEINFQPFRTKVEKRKSSTK